MNRISLRFAYVAILAILLQGCGIVGDAYEGVDIDTTRKQLLVATTETRAANLLLQDLVRSGAIDNDDARSALASLRDARDALQTGLDLIDAGGDPRAAETALQRGERWLGIALSVLSLYIGDAET